MVPGTVKLLHQKKTIKISGDQEGCKLNLDRLLMIIDSSAGKGTSGINKLGSVIDRINMKLESMFLISLKFQLLKRLQLLKGLQRVIVVDGATHSHKVGVEGNGDSFRNGAEAFCAVPVWFSADSAV